MSLNDAHFIVPSASGLNPLFCFYSTLTSSHAVCVVTYRTIFSILDPLVYCDLTVSGTECVMIPCFLSLYHSVSSLSSPDPLPWLPVGLTSARAHSCGDMSDCCPFHPHRHSHGCSVGPSFLSPGEFPLMEPLQCEKSKGSVGSQWQLSGLIAENATQLDPGRPRRQHVSSSAFPSLC